MPRSEDRPREWGSEAESSAASGGHVTPDAGRGTSAFGPLEGPLPSEVDGRRDASKTESGSSTRSRTSASARGDEVTRSSSRARSRRAPARRVKRRLRHIDPLSVLKISLIFYVIFLVFWLLGVALFYSFLESLGLFEAAESLGRSLVLWEEVDISLGLVERWAFLIGLTLVVVGAIINMLLAFLYNVISDLVGGIDMTFVEREQQ